MASPRSAANPPANSQPTENFPALAREAYALSDRLCVDCRNFHALWLYRRMTRVVEGPEGGAAALEAELARLLDGGGRKVLIAGAADSGVLALAARAGLKHAPEFLVIDRCETPLELCRRFARAWGLSVATQKQDLLELDRSNEFDVVIAHSLMQFLPADRRIDFLARVARALRRDGRLVLVFNTSRPIVDGLVPEYRGNYASWVLDELERMQVSPPEPTDTFRARLDAYARERTTREGAFAAPEAMSALIEGAGMVVHSLRRIESNLAGPFQTFVDKLGKQRHLMVAGPAG